MRPRRLSNIKLVQAKIYRSIREENMNFQAYHGVDAAQHQAKFNTLSAQGYRMISLSVYGDAGSPLYPPFGCSVAGPPGSPFTALMRRLIKASSISGLPRAMCPSWFPRPDRLPTRYLPRCSNRESPAPGRRGTASRRGPSIKADPSTISIHLLRRRACKFDRLRYTAIPTTVTI
jgi:Bacterial tandem repeat domain 1